MIVYFDILVSKVNKLLLGSIIIKRAIDKKLIEWISKVSMIKSFRQSKHFILHTSCNDSWFDDIFQNIHVLWYKIIMLYSNRLFLTYKFILKIQFFTNHCQCIFLKCQNMHFHENRIYWINIRWHWNFCYQKLLLY